MRERFVPANRSLNCSRTQETYESPFPIRAGGPILTSCVLAAVIGAQRPLRQQSCQSLPPHTRFARFVAGSFKSLTPPDPHAKLAGAFVKRVRIRREQFLSRPLTMHGSARTGPPYGDAPAIRHYCPPRESLSGLFMITRQMVPVGCFTGRKGCSYNCFLCVFETLLFHRRVGRLIDPAANGRPHVRNR
jgi:hypothetical protein